MADENEVSSLKKCHKKVTIDENRESASCKMKRINPDEGSNEQEEAEEQLLTMKCDSAIITTGGGCTSATTSKNLETPSNEKSPSWPVVVMSSSFSRSSMLSMSPATSPTKQLPSSAATMPGTAEGEESGAKNSKNAKTGSSSEMKLREPKRSTAGEAVFDFFCASRIKQKSIRLPHINLQRGPVIAIFFTLLISSIIIWYILTGDHDGEGEEDDHELPATRPKGNRYLNSARTTNKFKNETLANQLDQHQQHHHQESDLVFVLVTTLLIVLAIIAFVFIGAMVHYYKKPNPFAPSSVSSRSGRGSSTADGHRRRYRRSLSIVSSIFTHHNHHNFLYYLEKNDELSDVAKKSIDENSSCGGGGNHSIRVERETSNKSRKSRRSMNRESRESKKAAALAVVGGGSTSALPPIYKAESTSLRVSSLASTPTSPSIPTTPPPIIIVNELN